MKISYVRRFQIGSSRVAFVLVLIAPIPAVVVKRTHPMSKRAGLSSLALLRSLRYHQRWVSCRVDLQEQPNLT